MGRSRFRSWPSSGLGVLLFGSLLLYFHQTLWKFSLNLAPGCFFLPSSITNPIYLTFDIITHHTHKMPHHVTECILHYYKRRTDELHKPWEYKSAGGSHVRPLSCLTALWTKVSSGSQQRSERQDSSEQQWRKCLPTEIVTVRLAASEWSSPPYVRLRSSLAPGSLQRWLIFRQEIIFNFLSVKAVSVEKVPEKNEKMTNTNRTPSR